MYVGRGMNLFCAGEEAGGKSGKKKEFPGFMVNMQPGNSYSPDLRCFC
jgi:hypothetical protein